MFHNAVAKGRRSDGHEARLRQLYIISETHSCFFGLNWECLVLNCISVVGPIKLSSRRLDEVPRGIHIICFPENGYRSDMSELERGLPSIPWFELRYANRSKR